ncbi:MAG TPA: hypothetical protein VF593_00940 [Chthoniobacteraceae bacterium]|jgi:hypothetical protein
MNIEKLREIASEIEATGKPRWMTVRQLLETVGHDRRGRNVSHGLRVLLKRARLKCEPDFENTHIDSHVQLTLGPRLGRPPKSATEAAESGVSAEQEEAPEAEEAEAETPILPSEVAVPLPC